MKWSLKEIEIKSDSATVVSWIKTMVLKNGRIKSKGITEMLVKRRLGLIS